MKPEDAETSAGAVPDVVVVGGGLAGLVAAETLVRGKPPRRVTLVEPGRPGGVLGTVRHDGGWLVERSADCFLGSRPEAIQLVVRLGLEDRLIGVDPRVRRALVWHAGRTVPAPRGFRLLAPGSIRGILGSPLLSPLGRLRVLAERFVPARRPTDVAPEESLESFAVRRLGREAFERLVQPLAAGIWTADPARLGMAAACAEFLAMERDCGSLWAGERARLRSRGADAAAAGARYGQFVTLIDGLQALTDALVGWLTARGVRFVAAGATRLERQAQGGWRLTLAGAEPALRAAGVVLATPAPVAAALLADVDAALAAELGGIACAGSGIVSLGFQRDDVAHPLDAAGLVVPRRAGRRALAVSFSSAKFPGRAPAGCVLVRVFLGGALDPGTLDLDDDALVALARTEVAALIGARGTPRLVQIDRWPTAMPQYHVGHAERVRRITTAAARHDGLTLAGAAYGGVGIPQVIASGEAAGRALADDLVDG